MQIKLLVSAAAIALIAGLASASAAEGFAILEGIPADAITAQEMAVVSGAALNVNVPNVALAASGNAGLSNQADGAGAGGVGRQGNASCCETSSGGVVSGL